MAETCCASNGDVMILTCSGGSNVGQLSNRAAVELTQEGFGRMFCLAGIGGGISGFIQSAKDVPKIIAIDGCPVGCARAILENAEVPIENHVMITDLGIEKNKDFNLKKDDIRMVKDAVQAITTRRDSAGRAPSGYTGSCC